MTCIFIDSQSSCSLVYDQGGVVTVYDQTCPRQELTRTVLVKNSTQLEWYGVMREGAPYRLHFVTESGKSLVHMLLLSHDHHHVQCTLRSTLSASHTVTDIHLLSLVGDEGSIDLNGTVEIVS